MTISTGLVWFQPKAAASRRRGPVAAHIAPLILASTVLAAPGAAWAAVLVTDAPAFAVAIDAGESVIVSCSVGQVRVEVVGVSTTDYLTSCASVTSLTVTAAGTFDSSIDLSAVAAASFPNANLVLLSGGPGDDTLIGSALVDTFTWIPGDGNDTILGGSGNDRLNFNGSAANENVSVVADGSGFDIQRDIGLVTLDVAEVESSNILLGEGLNSLVVQSLVGVAHLARIGFNGGTMADVVNGAAQTNPAIYLALSGGAGVDQLTGGSGNDTFLWNPGDGNDDIAGSGGSDTLEFHGSGANETFSIAETGGGFDLFRDVASVQLETTGVEVLFLFAEAGNDVVMTVPLGASQMLIGGEHATLDTLQVDALGECATIGAGTIEIPGYLVIQHAAFEDVDIINTCVDTIFLDGFESAIP